MPVKGKEITTITLKEELQVYYNGYTNIKHINVPLAYTDNGDISISKITSTDGTVYVETDYGETWAIPISNIAVIIYKENTETTPEIKSNKLDSIITGADTSLVDTARLKGEDDKDTSSNEEHYAEVKISSDDTLFPSLVEYTKLTVPANTTIEGKHITATSENTSKGKGEDGPNIPKFIKRQDRLYPTEPINAYEFFKNNQEQLSHGNYPFNAGIYKSTLRRNDRATHAFVLDNAHMDVNELEQAFLAPISLHELTYKKLLYVTQDSEGNYEMVMDTSTDWDNPKYRGLEPNLFK